MSRERLERLRVPAALLLVAIVAVVLWPRGEAEPAAGIATPTPAVIVGEPGGAVIGTEPPTAEPTPMPTVATPTATPDPTDAPPSAPAADGFAAEILACRSISGSECRGQLGTLPATAGSFTALVRFTDANGGDLVNAILDGPSGTISGTPYALQGGGDGYFWSQFQVAGLPAGDYVLTATRNGVPVATTSFTKGG